MFHGFKAEDDVFGNGKRLNQHEVLMHHADPQLNGFVRRIDVRLFTVYEDFALCGLIQAVEDVHQRGLARAVLAENRVNLSLVR